MQSNLTDSDSPTSNSSYDQKIAQIVNDYGGLVYGCSLRILKNHQHAEDVTQATFILFSQKFREFSGDVKIGGWLYRTATFIAKNELKTEERRMSKELESAEKDTTSSPDWQAVSPYIDELIAVLPENQRSAILLKYMQGKSQEEIGTLMNCSKGTVSSWISRGLESLRKKLRTKGIVLTGSALSLMLNVKLKAESVASINSVVLQGISAGRETPLLILKNYIGSQALLKLKMVASGLALILTLTGYIFFSNLNKPFSGYDLAKNEILETAQSNPVVNLKSPPSSKEKVIPSVSPLIIGQSGMSFSGTIEDLKVSPDGQTLAVLTRPDNSSHIHLLGKCVRK